MKSMAEHRRFQALRQAAGASDVTTIAAAPEGRSHLPKNASAGRDALEQEALVTPTGLHEATAFNGLAGLTAKSAPSDFRAVPDLMANLSDAFDRFYHLHVVRVPGAKLSSSELRRCYLDWASRSRRPSLSYRELRVAMEARGHRKIHSDGQFYVGAAFADRSVVDAADIAAAEIEASARSELIERIDQFALELGALRARLIASINDGQLTDSLAPFGASQ